MYFIIEQSVNGWIRSFYTAIDLYPSVFIRNLYQNFDNIVYDDMIYIVDTEKPSVYRLSYASLKRLLSLYKNKYNCDDIDMIAGNNIYTIKDLLEWFEKNKSE